MKRLLVIQTAFIGDAILASSILEKLHEHYPDASIDILVRKGNETLFVNHPFLNNILVRDKTAGKIKSLFRAISWVRRNKYTHIINCHRFLSSGMITLFSGADEKTGFDKNPLSFCYDHKIKHEIGNGKHEVERNHELIRHLTDDTFSKPRLYPSGKDYELVEKYKTGSYITIAPASVWFTKQFPQDKWISFTNNLDSKYKCYLIGSAGDSPLCEQIVRLSSNSDLVNLAGKLTLLQTAALMKDARMNYVNDSAPMHLASAMNAPVTSVFCSTVPEFGFTPLSDNSRIVQVSQNPECRPCGLHGHKECPEKHFRCAKDINVCDLYFE